MRFRPLVILSTAFLLAAPVLARQDVPDPTRTGRKAVSTDTSATMKSMEGTVKEFDPGKKLVLATADSKTKTFRLDEKGLVLDIDPSVAVGAHVKVTVLENGDGTSKLTVEPTSKSS